MLRLGAIFVVLCMVLIAACTGAALYLLAGFNAFESMIVAVAVLTGLAIYNAVTSRLRDRSDVGSQIADLSRGTGDLARQVAELGRRTAALEGQSDKIVDSAAEKTRIATEAVTGELAELGTLVKQLAETVALHELKFAGARDFGTPAANQDRPAAPAEAAGDAEPAADSRDEMIATRARRHRFRPCRSLPAADCHLAAAQGPLLRGVYPASHCGRRRAAAIRVS